LKLLGVGHLIRRGTYLQLLPTSVHNLKISLEWLTDEIFHRYIAEVTFKSLAVDWGALAAVVLTSSGLLIWRTTSRRNLIDFTFNKFTNFHQSVVT